MSEYVKILQDKLKEAPFITLFLFLFGSILVITGTAETIPLLEPTFTMMDKFRSLIVGMGFLFIILGIVLAIKDKSPPRVQPIPESNSPIFYTFHGLNSELRKEPIFQDFKVNKSKGINRNAVYYMWADTSSKNSIQASIDQNNNDGSFLKIIFNNNDLWFSNIAIHPISEQALDNRSNNNTKYKHRFLKISARAQTNNLTTFDKVAVIIRVCDKNLTYWEYTQRPGEYKQLPVTTGDWQQISVDLEDDKMWHKFESDGNYQNPSRTPDFTVISGVVLVLGGYNENGQLPKFGAGIIDVHEISLDV